jgi:hypothetical protein
VVSRRLALLTSLSRAGHDDPSGARSWVHQAGCGGGAWLVGTAMVLIVPAAGFGRPVAAPAAKAATAPSTLRSALLVHELFRPPQAS